MTIMHLVLDPGDVNTYLRAYDLEKAVTPAEAALLQLIPSEGYAPSVMLVGVVSGQVVILKTTLKLFLLAGEECEKRAVKEYGENWRAIAFSEEPS